MLEMAGIQPRQGLRFDGESIVPLLKGTGKLRREAVFCHFPHYIPATGNLPGTSVRQGDWKLIRLYGEGSGRSCAYELYNLKDDIGETINLAEKFPEKVKQLDGLISRHLEETGALVPIPNPAYNGEAGRRDAAKAVHGWRPSGDCGLSAEEGTLRVKCTGGDPFLHTTAVPRADGPVTVKVRIKSATRGAGQIFWGTTAARRFHRTRSVTFRLAHDGNWHEHAIDLPASGRLSALRLDPGTGPGLVEIDWVRLCAPKGAILKSWDF